MYACAYRSSGSKLNVPVDSMFFKRRFMKNNMRLKPKNGNDFEWMYEAVEAENLFVGMSR